MTAGNGAEPRESFDVRPETLDKDHGDTPVRIRTDDDRPIQTFAHSYPATTYPSYPRQVRLGDAVASDIYCCSNPSAQVNTPWPYGTGFDVRCALFHPFWKPCNITLDFTGMNLYIAPGKAG
jgi:hypothetical protein